MRSKRWASWIVGVALVGGSCFAGSAQAQVQINNQSDVSGTNVFNNTAPRFPSRPGLNPDTLATANRLAQELTAARNAYNTTEQAVTRVPRRFARGPGEECVNPALSRLNEAIRASQEFLSGLDSTQVEQLKSANLKIW
ncbi:hypothetical protein [Trichocoleus sp. FACHB-262]|uniref:hypothetical protein n=1 Tax=Trichocoleus sp. FACHB-262 TaxID=2692869 RepID=UPI00168720A5|nr:hypothetical protein [Trichocoleus sp. FACHB-262]MBD2121664.1 hypothetical protein [Trichocoleus sp. FACHB-262]